MKMKMKSCAPFFSMLFFFVTFTSIQVCFADFDNLQDTCPAAIPPIKQTIFINGLPCKDPSNITAQDFKTTKLSKPGPKDDLGASMNIVTAFEFPGLNTLGLSIARTDLDVDGAVDLHNHPRATEIIIVKEGFLVAGFLDTQNKVFQKFLKVGDVFVFPKGLFHYLLNRGSEHATVISVFNSQNPGVGSLGANTPPPSGSGTTLESIAKLKKRLISLSDSESLPGLESIYD